MDGYQLKIAVCKMKRPIWRSVNVSALITFDELHQLIQVLFGLDNCHLYEFQIKSSHVLVTNREVDDLLYRNFEIVDDLNKIGDYFMPGMVIDYRYDFGDNWEFVVTVEDALKETGPYPIVLDYYGYNLIEDCGGITNYQTIIKNYNDKVDCENICFDLTSVNSFLATQWVETNLNDSAELKKDFVAMLTRLKAMIKERKIDNSLVIKLVSTQTTYWVILKTIEGYVIELFMNYEDLLDGYYNIMNDGINNAFCNCWTFLMSDEGLQHEVTLDDNDFYAVFRNVPGYAPAFLKADEAKQILELLSDFASGIAGDQSVCEDDEIIEIIIAQGQFKESSLFVHEPQIDLRRYEFGDVDKYQITTNLESSERLCVDIVCLPGIDAEKTGMLDLYAVIAGEEDYVINKAECASYQALGEALIAGICEYIDTYGKPHLVVVNNLNVLFMILEFISENNIEHISGEITAEIDAAISAAFRLDDEFFEDPFIQKLLAQLDGKNEDEIEEKLNEILANMELLN